MCPKNSGSLRTACFGLFLVSRPLLQPVRDCPRSGIKRSTINGEHRPRRTRGDRVRDREGGREGGRVVGRKSTGKRTSRESEKANRKEERNEGPRNSLGSLPSGLVLAVPACSATFSSSRAFFFFSSSHCRFKHSFEQVRPPCFSSSACTYRLVCVQATFACSDRERGKQREKDGGGGTRWTEIEG